MRKGAIGIGVAALLAACGPAQTPTPPPTPPAQGDTAPVDYARDAAWICRPGVDDGTCSANLDAVAIDAAGKRTPAPFVAARDPQVDCFYVYPTVSDDPSLYADMNVGAEEKRAVHSQAARLASVCRLFAPAYHQVTMTALRYAERSGDLGAIGHRFDIPYRDVLAAWRDYLRRDNRGRGVILVGHSQGAFLLRKLIAEEIDGKPVRARLIAAYLAGNGDLTASTFKTIPACGAQADTGCLVAWSSYRDGYQGRRDFGGGTICVDPAGAGDGALPLKAYFSRPREAPETDPPYVELIGQLTARCRRDAQGAVLSVRIEPGPQADRLESIFAARSPAPAWGLHPLDISLVQGNMIDRMAAQAAAWSRR